MKYLLPFFVFFVSNSFGQINPSDGCPTGAALPVNATCTNNTYFMNGTYVNGALVAPSCGGATSNRDDGWYSFVATASAISIRETSTDRTHLIQVWTACGGGVNLGCDMEVFNVTCALDLTGLTIGTTYYIQLQRRSGNDGSNMNGTICVYATPNPDTGWPGANLGTLACNSSTNQLGTTAAADVSCTVSSAGDHIYSFTTTSAADVTIDLCGSSYDNEIHLFNLTAGNCNGAPIGTNDDACGVQSSLTMTCLAAGTYVIIIEGSGAANGAYDMNVVINDCGCTALANDDACTATLLPVNTTCVTTAGTNVGATNSTTANPGCANYGGSDVWYKVVVPADGWLFFETTAGTMTDGGLAIYSGSCGDLTLISCDDNSGAGNMSKIENSTLTPGATIYIRQFENGGNFEGTYNICVYEPDCSANITNDFCEDPGNLFINGASSFSSSTAALYTADNPNNIDAIFCGTIQNNSWYQFTATATTHTFPISVVAGCVDGIQAEVYSYNSTTACCKGFASVSNCYNPGNTTLGTVTAVGLTIGEQYILMIDGWAGANCDFTITGWSGTNILPVELVNFTGIGLVDKNQISWKTKSEINSDWFVIESSVDGINFAEVGRKKAAGNSSANLDYSFDDFDFNHSIKYYRLKAIDFDGTYEYSQTISIARDMYDLSVFPNPSNGVVYVSKKDLDNYDVTLTNSLGQILEIPSSIDNGQMAFDLNHLPNGTYFVLLSKNGMIEARRFVLSR